MVYFHNSLNFYLRMQEKRNTTAKKRTLKLVKLQSLVPENIFSLTKFANFVYNCITLGKT